MWCASAHGLVYDFHQATTALYVTVQGCFAPWTWQVGGLHTSGRRGSPASCQLCFSLCVWCWRGCAPLHVQLAGVCPNPESPRAGLVRVHSPQPTSFSRRVWCGMDLRKQLAVLPRLGRGVALLWPAAGRLLCNPGQHPPRHVLYLYCSPCKRPSPVCNSCRHLLHAGCDVHSGAGSAVGMCM